MQPTKPSNGAGCFDGPYLTPVVRDGAIQRWRASGTGTLATSSLAETHDRRASAPLPASGFRGEGISRALPASGGASGITKKPSARALG